MRRNVHRGGALGGAGLAAALALCLAAAPAAAQAQPQPADTAGKPDWRHDPSVRRRPGSYLGGAIGYVQSRVWIPENESHDALAIGPVHTYGIGFRVGDAFAEWFTLGFQVQIMSGKNAVSQVGAFDLLLDGTFYPVGGLGIRPAVGVGFGFARGEHKWEMGGGGPGCLALGVLHEFRVLKLFTIAPVVQVSWITGESFDGLFVFAGVELVKWFATATG